MSNLNKLQTEVQNYPQNVKNIRNLLLYEGFNKHLDDPAPIARAFAIQSLFTAHKKHIYQNDLIAGSMRGLLADSINDNMINRANSLIASFGQNNFGTNADHFAPDYETFLSVGVGGILKNIKKSLLVHRNDVDFEKKKIFLDAAYIAMEAFSKMIEQYAFAAQDVAASVINPEERKHFEEIANTCNAIKYDNPKTFRQALQLVWLVHVSFFYEGRYAMALGRIDQYLYQFYKQDIDKKIATNDEVLDYIQCTFCKTYESRYFGGDDVVNICIGGVKRNGTGALNELSYIVLEAVKNCNIPGPNLSARLYKDIPNEFIDACLKVIGTGLGYPALMNDEVNIPALHRHGYAIEDSRDYCMVGCIENFLQGKQPPWSDGRYNVPKYIELVFNNGKCMLTDTAMGPDSGEVEAISTMEQFMEAFKKQLIYGASEYMVYFRNDNDRFNKEMYSQPYLSCYCQCCIERGLDINNGGALYPSTHGAGCMGIATVADSLAAIEEVVFNKKLYSIQQLKEALLCNFEGYDELRNTLLNAPKYGNNNDFVDKYAVWYVEYLDELFGKYSTRDGGKIYTAIASNVQNISAGSVVAATPDGRKAREPMSDAASPMHGMDISGPTSVINSVSKPNYTLVSCGTVLNQKFSPSMFTDSQKRSKLAALIRTYFSKGGQEIQINSVSREVLFDAMKNPNEYKNLVVRVSGFSAYYTNLDVSIQKDILDRTEQE
jgi:pyruvate formate-lyase/glycerol dehydratase family glycyl radical enzyme